MSKTHIAFIIDRSGSMGNVKKDTIGGFNQFLNDQKEANGFCTMTLVQFDHEIETLHRTKDIMSIPELNNKTYVPRGMTALFDAIGNTIHDTSDYIDGLDDDNKPDNVIFVIQTDGHENKSTGFDGATIKEMIDFKEDECKWDFIYLGAGQDAIATGAKFGIKSGKAMSYNSDSIGTQTMFASVSASVSEYRSSVDVSLKGTNFDFFSEADRKDNE